MRLKLSDLQPGENALIEEIALSEPERQLLARFGFFDGAQVRCSRRAPLGDPIVYSVDGSEIALRIETACQIFASRVAPGGVSELTA